MIVEQKMGLRRMQLQTLFVSVQSFIHQFSNPSLGDIYNYIDAKNPAIFPLEIKEIVKQEVSSELR